ncbi:MAG: PAS-domain containing protein [Caulobacterales bacterium]|nr:PAS-domain containing protein [Caulobacterales bacterium]
MVAVAKAMNGMAQRLGGLYADIRHDLDRRNRMLASTFEHMNQGVAIFDAEGRLVEVNEAFAGLIGLPPAVIVAGIHLDALVDFHAEAGAYRGGAEEESLEASCRSRDWPGPSLTFRLPFPDGRAIAVQRTRLPDGGFIAVHEDITRQLQDERRLRHAAKLTTLGRLATATAHELNQPLNVIRLSADNAAARLAADTASPEYLAERLQRISAQTERAARIIDHMRIFGRMPAEEPAPFDLGETVRSAAEFFGETARLRGLRLDLCLDPGLMVTGHPALIEQVVANILSNAFAALAAADVASPTVRIGAARRGGRIRVEVADNAGGVPADVLPRIFEPFFTTKSVHEGTGLGLSISYGIVADMGGRLEVENRGEGAVFSFELQALGAPAPAAEAAA